MIRGQCKVGHTERVGPSVRGAECQAEEGVPGWCLSSVTGEYYSWVNPIGSQSSVSFIYHWIC